MSGGEKIYDGETESLFNAYQTRKKITLSFDVETDFSMEGETDNFEIVEQTPFKVVLMIPKENSSQAIADLVLNYSPADISAEEEDIGTVVERIYGGGA